MKKKQNGLRDRTVGVDTDSIIKKAKKLAQLKAGNLFTYVFGDILKTGFDVLLNMIKAKIFYKIDLTEMRIQIDNAVLLKYFKNIPTRELYPVDYKIKDIGKRSRQCITYEPGTYADVIIVDNVKIGLILTIPEDRSLRHSPEMYMVCLNKKENIKILNKFLKHLVKKSAKVRSNRAKGVVNIFHNGAGGWDTMTLEKRTFDDVFIPQQEQQRLVNSIQNFINKREWYESHNIPYHYGILLHGPAGTGKSSIIKALCNHFDAEIAYIEHINIDDIRTTIRGRSFVEKPCFVIIEDIDTYEFTNNRHYQYGDSKNDNDESSPKNKLGKLLNFMDGFNSPSNVIYIFTTNYIHDLDYALIRPGRIDICSYVPTVIPETLDRFMFFHFGRHIPNMNIVIKPNMTFGEMQSMVMNDITFEEILNIVTVPPIMQPPVQQPIITPAPLPPIPETPPIVLLNNEQRPPMRPGFSDSMGPTIGPKPTITTDELAERIKFGINKTFPQQITYLSETDPDHKKFKTVISVHNKSYNVIVDTNEKDKEYFINFAPQNSEIAFYSIKIYIDNGDIKMLHDDKTKRDIFIFDNEELQLIADMIRQFVLCFYSNIGLTEASKPHA